MCSSPGFLFATAVWSRQSVSNSSRHVQSAQTNSSYSSQLLRQRPAIKAELFYRSAFPLPFPLTRIILLHGQLFSVTPEYKWAYLKANWIYFVWPLGPPSPHLICTNISCQLQVFGNGDPALTLNVPWLRLLQMLQQTPKSKLISLYIHRQLTESKRRVQSYSS